MLFLFHVMADLKATEGFPWDDLRKIFTEGSQMAKVPFEVGPLKSS